VLTHAESVNNTANNHLRQMPGHNLEDGANGIADEAEGDGLFAAELVTEGKGEDGTAEGAELSRVNVAFNPEAPWREATYREATGGNARDIGLLSLGEPVLEVGRDQHARENALIVAEP
jgi:hypothetical protein